MLEVKTNIRSTDKSMAPNEKTRTAFHSVLAILVWIAHSSFPGIKRSKTEIKASFLVHLRQVFFFCFFNPTINVQVGNEEPQTMLHTTTAHLHYQQNLYWWVRKNTVCFKIKKKKKLKNSKFRNFWKPGLILYSSMSQDDEIRAYECGNNRCISKCRGYI